MSDITQRTIGELIDELITTSLKCWYAQETIMNETDTEKIAVAAKLAQETNARRNALIRAIDEKLGEGDSTPLPKTYA
jgi:hypothetical protein